MNKKFLPCNGFIIGKNKYKDYDNIITLYTKEYGKISAFLKGNNIKKNQHNFTNQLLNENKFLLIKGSKYFYIGNSKILNCPTNINGNYDKIIFSLYLLEILNKNILEEKPSKDLYRLIKDIICQLDEIDNTNLNKLKIYFSIKFTKYMGYLPTLSICNNCKYKFQKGDSIYYEKDNLLCKKCNTDMYNNISFEILKLIYIMSLYDINFIINMKIEENIIYNTKKFFDNLFQQLFNFNNQFYSLIQN